MSANADDYPGVVAATDADRLVDELTEGFRNTAREVVPWFMDQMPQAYLRDTDEREQRAHLRAIIAARASGLPTHIDLRSQDKSVWTFIRERDYPGLLAEILAEIPDTAPLRLAKVHSAKDGELVLDTLYFGESPRFDPTDAALAEKRAQVLEVATAQGIADTVELEKLAMHFESCSFEYLRAVGPKRIFAHYAQCRRVAHSDDTLVGVVAEGYGERGLLRIEVASGGARPQQLFQRLCTYLGQRRHDIRRAYLDVFESEGVEPVSIVGIVVADDERLHGDAWPRVERELSRLRWVDDATLELAYGHGLDLVEAEVAVALSHLAHTRLAQRDRHAFARPRLSEMLLSHGELAQTLARLFLDRFDPGRALDSDTLAARRAALLAAIASESPNGETQSFFEQMVACIDGTLRTNVHVPQRYGLSLRLGPEVVVAPERKQPFGVFFVHGRGFDAFHVRFRDVARGGVRVVRPASVERYALEVNHHFDEVYDLAHAQQLKNKDIPEGGAKAVILARPGRPIGACVRAFADGLLDLISPTSSDAVVNHPGAEEMIYLGPDENISPELIEWIVDRAERRGYPHASAFMSSKPGAGINHKAYGVTSEGVTVFLDEALRYVGIDPRKQPFSVKLTGGPDGDVAGNEIKILFREYGNTVRIVGIADGSGGAEDPDGLDREALLALVAAEQPVAALAKVGPRGRLVRVTDPDGAKFRDSLHNRVLADAFVPAGGRPGTLHSGNWQAFLTADGKPSSRVIVEGANLFVTAEARQALSAAGVVVVKDSSANKCGVICSSFEIAACMLLSPAVFVAHKEQLVAEVLERLRDLARREAQVLFRELRQQPRASLPDLSVELSREVERAADAVAAAYAELPPTLVRRLVTEHLPPTIVALAGDVGALPERYAVGIVSASLATRMVYREGLAFLRHLGEADLAALAVRYLQHEDESRALAAAVRASDLADRERIAALLELGGPRAGTLLDG